MNDFTLSIGQQQQTVLLITGAMSLIVITFLVFAALQFRKDIPYDKVTTVGYRFRRPWGLGLTLLLVIIGLISFSRLPATTAPTAKGESDITKVKVTAAQFGFQIDPMVISTDKALFEVTSIDVNHGYGVYDPEGRLIGQTQAMPGRINRFVLDLKTPGSYKVLCMEYCGLFHHAMLGSFDVKKAA